MEPASFSSLPFELYLYMTELGRIPREMARISPETRVVTGSNYFRVLCSLPITRTEVDRYLLNPIFPIYMSSPYDPTRIYIVERNSEPRSIRITESPPSDSPSYSQSIRYLLTFAPYERYFDLLTLKRILTRRGGCIRLAVNFVRDRLRRIITLNTRISDPNNRERYLYFYSRILNPTSDRLLSPEEILSIVLARN
jgi:hypothetical protein